MATQDQVNKAVEQALANTDVLRPVFEQLDAFEKRIICMLDGGVDRETTTATIPDPINDAGCCVEAAPSGFGMVHMNNERNNIKLDYLLGRLHKVVQGVLTPERPTEDCVKEAESPNSDISHGLFIQAQIADGLLAKLEELIDRIDL